MLKILASLSALIAAISLVVFANATMMTILPLRMLENGSSDRAVAILATAYSLGFLVGCFSEPARILRVGYIRAFAAAAALATTLAIVTDFTASDMLWIAMRFLTGICIAAISASVDGWINAATPDAVRGRVFSIYTWCTGLAQVLGQLLLVRVDGLEVGFVTLLAIGFNLAVVLVALTKTAAPPARQTAAEAADAPPAAMQRFAISSWTGALAAAYSGIVFTLVASILPGVLSGSGVPEAGIALAIASFYIGRLVLQIPIGALSDRMDQHILIAIMAALIGAIALLGSFLVIAGLAGLAEWRPDPARYAFLLITALVGGLGMPIYAVGNSLAFARGKHLPPVTIATTLLLAWSLGAVAGPALVAMVAPMFGIHAMSVVVAAVSAVLVFVALGRRVLVGRSATPIAATLSDVPVSSVALAESFAEVEAVSHQPAEDTGGDPDGDTDGDPEPTRP
jgi:MFS family permease